MFHRCCPIPKGTQYFKIIGRLLNSFAFQVWGDIYGHGGRGGRLFRWERMEMAIWQNRDFMEKM